MGTIRSLIGSVEKGIGELLDLLARCVVRFRTGTQGPDKEIAFVHKRGECRMEKKINGKDRTGLCVDGRGTLSKTERRARRVLCIRLIGVSILVVAAILIVNGLLKNSRHRVCAPDSYGTETIRR